MKINFADSILLHMFAIQTCFIFKTKIMKTQANDTDQIDEQQSLRIIREMIQVSQQKLKNDGILIILWGWIQALNCLTLYAMQSFILTYRLTSVLKILFNVLFVCGIAGTIAYLYWQRKTIRTYIGISLRYVWGGLVVCMVLVSLIQNNVLHQVMFEFQHPVFMVLTAFAIVITGGIMRYKLLVGGGVLFGIAALLSSYLALPDQLLVEAISWFLTFAVPGHILYSKRLK